MKRLKKILRSLIIKILEDGKKDDQQQNYVSPEFLNDNYLFDFKNYAAGHASNSSISTITVVNGDMTGSVQDPGYNRGTFIGDGVQKAKIKVKPIDVLDELERIPTPFSLLMIDEKIDILKEKSKLIGQNYAKREVDGLIERLENRKKYEEHKEFFERFQNTTDEKIADLLNKYDNLIMNISDIFIPEFPDVAIQRMKEYSEHVDALCGKKTVFYVIATFDSFKKSYQKRDPILLAQSPFGFYYSILGAWDAEMILLSEL